MARRGMSESHRREAAIQASRRMISRGERPMFRVRRSPEGAWILEGMTLDTVGETRHAVLDAARAYMAEMLGVHPSSFDLEFDGSGSAPRAATDARS